MNTKSKNISKGKTTKKKECEVELPKNDMHLYVYGIINKGDTSIKMNGLKNAPITPLIFKDIAALVSPYPMLHPMVEEKEIMLHAEIMNKLACNTTIIPMAFGMVFKDAKILEATLAKSYLAMKTTLGLIEAKIELGIKVVKNGNEDMPPEIVQEIIQPLHALSVKNVKGDHFSDRLLLNHSFLVEKSKFDQFSNKIGELEKKHPSLKFLYTGPWPAYSFVNIKIGGS